MSEQENAANKIAEMHAIDFVKKLPLSILAPVPCIDEDGEILFEWYEKPKNERSSIFSVIFDDNGYIFAKMSDGKEVVRGQLYYSPRALKIVLYELIDFHNNINTEINEAKP